MDEFRTLLNRFWVRRSEDRNFFTSFAASCRPCAAFYANNLAGRSSARKR